jgi:hypothetical protein
MSDKETYKLLMDGKKIGRYISSSPASAARKAYTKHHSKIGHSKFTIVDKDNKELSYYGKRIKLSTPSEYMIGDKTIKREYKIEVSRA